QNEFARSFFDISHGRYPAGSYFTPQLSGDACPESTAAERQIDANARLMAAPSATACSGLRASRSTPCKPQRKARSRARSVARYDEGGAGVSFHPQRPPAKCRQRVRCQLAVRKKRAPSRACRVLF